MCDAKLPFPHRFNELAAKGEKWNGGRLTLECVMTETDTLVGKTTLTSGLLLGRCEVLRSLRH